MGYLTLCDLHLTYILEILSDIEKHINENELIENFENLVDLRKRILGLKEIDQYKTDDERAKRTHFNHFVAKLKI